MNELDLGCGGIMGIKWLKSLRQHRQKHALRVE
jgi:hypothetical protein